MKIKIFFLFFLIGISVQSFAQEIEMTLDREFDEIEAPKEKPAEISTNIQQPVQKKTTPKIPSGTVNVGGGEKTIKIEHPNAAKGLLKINKDGSYQYKVPLKEKSKSTTVSFASFTSPRVTNSSVVTPITFSSMYGGSPMAILASYEWMPFRKYGSLGLFLESGFSVSRGRGQLADGQKAEEAYSLYIVPMTAFLKYRFEYVRRQWVVPYIMGGATYYGMLESRDDGAPPITAGSTAVGGGGGLHLNISRMDPEGAYRLDREWGIADMWLTVEMKVMQGLKPQIDFTNTTLQAGITFDY